jgi:hypothetical protein
LLLALLIIPTTDGTVMSRTLQVSTPCNSCTYTWCSSDDFLLVILGEHNVELQTLSMWIPDAIRGTLSRNPTTWTPPPTGAAPVNPVGPIDPRFFTDTWIRHDAVRGMANAPGRASGDADLWTVQDRVYNALGSKLNSQVFVLAYSELNCYKAIVSV